MNKVFLIILIMLSIYAVAEEMSITATNTMRFGLGREWAGTLKDVEIPKKYFEDWIDIEASKGNFSAGIRFESADSSKHFEKIHEISKIYFSYMNDDITVTAGDFYGSFGRGVVLGLREEKTDFFDSKVTGGKVEYCGELFGFKALGGKSYFKLLTDDDPKKYLISPENYTPVAYFDNTVMGAELSLPLSAYLNLEEMYITAGGSYLFVKGDSNDKTLFYKDSLKELYKDTFNEETDFTAFSIEAAGYGFEFYNEYAIKVTQRTPEQTGWANYTLLSWATRGLGLTFEYKDYYKYGANPNSETSGFTPYQNAPELTLVHSSHLLNMHPHEVKPNDEVGYKITAMYQLNDEISMNGSFSVASQHNGDAILPDLDDEFLPYTDSWIGINYAADNYSLIAAGGYFTDSPMEKQASETEVYTDKRTTFMAEVGYEINDTSELSFCGEYQTVTNEFLDEDYNDIYGSVEYGYSDLGYINLSIITTSLEMEGDAPDSWFGTELGLNIGDSHKLEVFYGRERAGIKCSGGTCRQVPEFDGLRMTLVSEF